jgi:hypothetical protein
LGFCENFNIFEMNFYFMTTFVVINFLFFSTSNFGVIFYEPAINLRYYGYIRSQK